MKYIALLFGLLASPAIAAQVDGMGIFPLLVQVMNADGVTPASEVVVKLVELPSFKEVELDPKKRIKVLPESLGEPVKTDSRGMAVLFFQSNWSEASGKEAGSSFKHGFPGTLVVEKDEITLSRVALADWARETSYVPQRGSALWIVITLEAPAE
jgi:hypothetical protein